MITSVTNLAVSISRNMDKMSLDEGHRRLCAIHRRSYKASHFGSGLSKGLTGLGLNLLSAVAGLVHQPMQVIFMFYSISVILLTVILLTVLFMYCLCH